MTLFDRYLLQARIPPVPEFSPSGLTLSLRKRTYELLNSGNEESLLGLIKQMQRFEHMQTYGVTHRKKENQ